MAFRHLATALTALLSLSTLASAQTWSDCNPMNVTTCKPNPALGTNVTFDFQAKPGDTDIWNVTARPVKYSNQNGAEFTINDENMSPTMQTNFFIFFGEVTVSMKAASGRGIISSIVIQSDDLDEIDWEFMGGNTTHAMTNYFGKGDTSSFDRAMYHAMPDGSAPQDGFHNYTTKWNEERMDFLIDGKHVRTLKYGDANGGHKYPQTPSNVRLGIWSGGNPKKNNKGTVEWAGGETDFSKAPFSMYVRNMYVKDQHDGAKEYVWGDKSGSFQSIKVVQGQSEAVKELTKPQGVTGRWNAMPQTTRTAIIACSLGGLALLVVAGLVFCCLQGRKGKKEKAIADAQWEKEQADFNQYRMQMMQGGYSQNSRHM